MTALRAIKRSLVDVNKNLSNWDSGDPCTSNWTGVLCYNQTLDDDYLHVQELFVSYNLSQFLFVSLWLDFAIEFVQQILMNAQNSLRKSVTMLL